MQDWLAAPLIRLLSGVERDRQHDQLRGDDARRHHCGCKFLVREREFLADQWQERRISKMKKRGAQRENRERCSAI